MVLFYNIDCVYYTKLGFAIFVFLTSLQNAIFICIITCLFSCYTILPYPSCLLHKANGKSRCGGFPHLLSRDDRRVCGQGEVDPGVGHQVGLELCEIHVEGAVEPERGGDGGHDLADQPVQVGVRGTLDVQVSPADVVDGFVVHHEGAVRVSSVVWVVRMEL